MKKIIACLTVLLLCVSLVIPAAAAEFTPSVTQKPAPGVVTTPDPDGNPSFGVLLDDDGQIISYIYGGCLVITGISEVKDSDKIPEDAKKLLLEIYEKLTGGEMSLPYEQYDPDMNPGNMVIRDLFDATFLCDEHPEMLEDDGVSMKVTLDIGVKPDTEVVTMVYIDNQWKPVVSTVNNGDGTITCVLEELCPIAISVPVEEEEPGTPTPGTGDDSGNQLIIWGAVALVALAAIVVLVVVGLRGSKKNDR